MDISEEFVEIIRKDLKRAYDKEILEISTGPLIYGPGNFEVYEDETGDWQIRPVEGWKPQELLGIFNVDREHETEEAQAIWIEEDEMKHDRIKKSDWKLIANKKVEDAEVTKVWKDTEGNIHVELTYPKE